MNFDTFLSKRFNSGDFVAENGHSVLLFGKHYPYNGSKSPETNEAIPEELKPFVDKLVKDLKLHHIPNSILVNHYPGTGSHQVGQDSSFLSHHSDKEAIILAGSKIPSLTLGGERKIVFRSIYT